MSSQKCVEVLCLNGRRQKIKTSSSSTILQVLKEACQKYGYNDTEIDLMHKRKVLDVTVTIGHANIPNNGKLEMVKRNIPRKASEVQVALQTEFSERLQHSFDPSCTLFDVLNYWNGDPGSPYHGKIICKTPVIVYMTRQISGVQSLRSTTLEKLGLISGRAAMRLTHKDKEDVSFTENPETISSKANLNNTTQRETKTQDKTPSDIVTERDADTVVLQDSFHTKGPSKAMAVDADSTKSNFSTDNQNEKESKEAREPKEKKQKLADTFTETPLQGVSTQLISTTNTQSVNSRPFNDFKFPDDDDVQKRFLNEVQPIDPKEIMMEVKLSMPCARNEVIFNYDQSQSFSNQFEEPSDEFFDVTVNELRRMMMDNNLKVEDEPLLTKAMREAKEKEKMLKYEKVIVRILFPDKYALQGVFRPLEEVDAVKDFVRQHLEDENARFELYTTPPKCVLKNLKQTLSSAKLVPSAIIRVSGQSESERWLKQELLDTAATYMEAEDTANEVFRRSVSTETSNSTSSERNSSQTEKGDKSTRKDVNTVAPSNKDKTKKSDVKVPKWFKQGKK